MNDDDDALGTLLSAATEELPCTSKSNGEKFLENIPDFPNQSKKLKSKVAKSVVTKVASNVHTGETDSSDDEENRYFETRKYDSFGSAIKQMLSLSTSSPTTSSNVKDDSTWQTKTKQLSVAPAKSQLKTDDVYTDPTFGIRIVNPLVSRSLLQERMSGRIAVSMANLKTHINNLKSETDWVIAGAIVHKSAARTSQKGSSYTIWTLSDLHHDLKTVTLFLFGNAFKELWKTGTGMVVGVLNPSILEKNSNTRDEAALSVDNAQRVMVLGQSKDLGTCKSTKKNGDHCTAFVNTNHCEFCLYHIKKEYQKCTKRSELQSTFAGRGLTALRNKVLGKNEVFYAGKSYMAIPAGKNKKLAAKDDRRLKALGNVTVNAEKTTKINNLSKRKAAAHLELSANQRARDLEMLKKLSGGSNRGVGGGESSNDKPTPFNASVSNEVTLEESKHAAVSVISKLKAAETNGAVINTTPPSNIRSNTADSKIIEKQQDKDKLDPPIVPLLTKSVGGKVDLNAPISRRLVNRAKLNALSWVKQNGPIQKSNSNKTRGTQGKKRPFLNLDGGDDKNGPPSAKQQKIEQNEFFSERFKKIMAISSRHSDLLEQHDNEEEAKYFSKLEKKEQMEEKMLTTYKVQCKAVRCLKCKYTSFSAAELCKVEKHPFKVFDAVKRFFKCGNCKNRTVTLTVVPTAPCGNCGGGKWERAPMLREKEFSAAHCLSIRGGEQTFLNSGLNNANLDLLVPDDK